MLKSLKNLARAGVMLGATLGFAAPALAGHDPVLTRIRLYYEHGRGVHHPIGNEQIHLTVHGYGNDHFDFEVKGIDQYGRFLPNCSIQPELVFPGNGVLGTLEFLGDNHFRFHTGSVPVADTHVIVRDHLRPHIQAALHISIAEPVLVHPRPTVVVPAPTVVYPAPVYYDPHPPVYYDPHPPVYVHPHTPVYVHPHTPRPYVPRRSFGLRIRLAGDDGAFGFSFFGAD